MRKLKANKGFFLLPSIPGIQFLLGTTYKECKQYNGALTLKEYNEVNGIKTKKEKPKLSNKKFKGKLEDKSL